MTDQQVTGSVDEAEVPVVTGQAEPQGEASGSVPPRPTEPDPLAAAAVDLARQAAEEVAQPNTVGRHLGVSVDTLGLTMHAFVCTAKGYRGWRWAVTLAHVPGTDRVTVCDSVLLPGAESIMAPDWVPWSDRLAPGDLGAGDELPFKLDDPYLVPGYTVTDEDDADQQLFWELGLGRERVLGPEGVAGAADRWQRGSHGPTADIAVQAAASCVSCAYFVPLSGRLRQHFGACANEWSPADGSVVTTDFGCGAHSETDLEMPAPEPLSDHILDETVVDRMELIDPEPGFGIETGSSVAAEQTEDVVEDGVEPVDAGSSSSSVDAVLSEDAVEPVAAVGSGDAVEPVDAAEPVEVVKSSRRRRRSRTSGGVAADVVEAEVSEPVAIDIEPALDPEPVASPEDVITVRTLGSDTDQAEPADVHRAVAAAGGLAPTPAEEPVAETATVLVEPVDAAPQAVAAEDVRSEVAEGSPEGQTVRATPEVDAQPPVALSPDAAAQDDEEIADSTEAVHGEAVDPAPDDIVVSYVAPDSQNEQDEQDQPEGRSGVPPQS